MTRAGTVVLFASVVAMGIGFAVEPVRASPTQAIVAPTTTGGTGWTASAIAKLGADLDAILAANPTIRGAHVGIRAVDTKTNAVLYSRSGDDEFQPASTLKLLVGSAAIEKLGPA